MALDPVPWFVGGGAEHSPEVARLLAYAATSGSEGIINVGDLKVAPLAVPGSSVRVLTGACAIRSNAAGGSQQTYIGRNVSETVVSISATGSGSGRSDLIVAQVEDPFMAGENWSQPTNAKVGPYIFIRVIPNVPAGTTRLQDVSGYSGRTAITLARIDIPANTGTITAGMIKDLRNVANPRRERRVDVFIPASATDFTAHDSVRRWYPLLNSLVRTPTWATQAQLVVSISNILMTGNLTGNVRAEYGYGPSDGGAFISTTPGGLHKIDQANTGDWRRGGLTMGGELAIPASFRGKDHYIRTGTLLNTEALTGKLTIDAYTTVVADIEFVEIPE